MLVTKTVYIASSWKNQHTVEMLTSILELQGHEVKSFVNEALKTNNRESLDFDNEWFMNSQEGNDKFAFDVSAAMESDLVVYIGPSGLDAWAEVGAAYGSGTMVVGLWAKGERIGLMRKMVRYWFCDYKVLVEFVNKSTVMRLSGIDRNDRIGHQIYETIEDCGK